MPNFPDSRPFWARLAAWLGCLAVFSALLVPASVLAEDVRTGKLGGLCSVVTGASAPDAPGEGDDAASTHAHCDMCGSSALGLPPLPKAAALPATTTAMARVFQDAVRSAEPPGLPFSRGPPVL